MTYLTVGSGVTNGTPAVFSIDGNTLLQNNNVQTIDLNLNGKTPSAIIINLTGTSINYSWSGENINMLRDTTWRPKILWHFPNATTVSLGKPLYGSILAPLATLTATGGANEGSIMVKDYQGTIAVKLPYWTGGASLCTDASDFGDSLAFADASSTAVTNIKLGANAGDVDATPAPNAAATADDLSGTDDEDGLTAYALTLGSTGSLTISRSNTSGANAFLNAWIDWDGDGVLGETNGGVSDQVISNVTIATGTSGSLSYSVTVPSSVSAGTVHARIRLTSTSAPGATDYSGNGEVEDHSVVLAAPNTDFGDATTYASANASQSAGTPKFGALLDYEAAQAADDNTSGADEDGIYVATQAILGKQLYVNYDANTTAASFVNLWIDWNRDGDFADAGEQVATNVPHSTRTTGTLKINVPTTATPGASWVRARISSASGAGPTGSTADGEVEDHPVTITDSIAINGVVFEDANNNGQRDAGERLMPAVQVGALDVIANSNIRVSTFTDASGAYSLLVPVGTWRISVWNPTFAAFTFATANVGSDLTDSDGVTTSPGNAIETANMVLASGAADVSNVDVGLVPAANSITYTASAPVGTDTWNTSLTLPKYYSTTAALSEVRTTITSLMSQDMYLENRAASSAFMSLTGSGVTLSASFPSGGTVMPTVGDTYPGLTLNADDSVYAFNPAAGLTTAAFITRPVNRGAQGSAAQPPANYTGTAAGQTLNVPITMTSVNNWSGGTTFDAKLTTFSQGGIAVTYYYEDRDFGDWAHATAPAGAATTTASSKLNANLRLGATVDREASVTPDVTATADGADEDGVTMPSSITQGASVSIPVSFFNNNTSGNYLQAWIDFNNDGTFNDVDVATAGGERIYNFVTNASTLVQNTNVVFTVPVTASVGAQRGVRFRLSNSSATTPTSSGATGEIEDYVVAINGAFDFSDAPASYGSARHTITAGTMIGTRVDWESAALVSAAATGDDLAGTPDDEDGVYFDEVLVQGRESTLVVAATGTGYVNVWIDYNRDGDFADAGEQVNSNMYQSFITPLVPGQVPPWIAHFTVPATASPGATFARVRYTSATWAGGPTGDAPSGEVEDLAVTILPASTIGGKVWADLDANGIRGGSESGLEGMIASLVRADGKTENITRTDISGDYLFTAVPPGTYTVQIHLPSGHSLSGQDLGGDDNADSDFNPTTSVTGSIALSNGSSSLRVDAGLQGSVNLASGVYRVTYAAGSTPGTTNWNGSVDLPKFDSRLGQLEAADFLTVMFYDDNYATENASTTATASEGLSLTHNLTLTMPNSSAYTTSKALTATIPLGIYDGALNYHDGSASTGFERFRATTVSPLSYPTLAQLTAATSGVNVTIPTAATDSFSVTGASNSVWQHQKRIGYMVSVTYRYSGLDYGDFLHPTAAASGMATTTTSSNFSSNLRLGATVDAEPSVTPNVTATADGADEDGVTMPASITQGLSVTIPVSVFNNNTAGKYLQGWIDFNNDGTFANTDVTSGGERIYNAVTTAATAAQTVNVTFTVPVAASVGTQRGVRFRLTDNSATTPTSSGAIGEIEDYIVDIAAPGSIAGKVFVDANNNGINNTEAALAGVTVQLYTGDGVAISGKSVVTTATGTYSFTTLPVGRYMVGFTLPSGYALGLTDEGSDDAVDSDATAHLGQTFAFDLTSGQSKVNVDAGACVMPSLGDRVWLDQDFDGIQDASETTGISGVTAQLYNSLGASVSGKNATSNASGAWAITGITPGDYTVQFGIPSGYLVSPQDQGGNETLDSDPNTSGRTGTFSLATSQRLWGSGNGDPAVGVGGDADLTWDGVTIRYDTASKLMKMRMSVTSTNAPNVPEVLTAVISAGPTPAQSGTHAILYLDYSTGTPYFSIYKYSFDPASAVNPSSFGTIRTRAQTTGALTVTTTGNTRVFDLSFDATPVLSYAGGAGWEGCSFDSKVGIWLRAWGRAPTVTYTSDAISAWNPNWGGDSDGQSFWDIANTDTFMPCTNSRTDVDFGVMLNTDYGDLVDTGAGTSAGNYATTSADNGPAHFYNANLRLGSLWDGESAGVSSANADGDDTAGADDEDGIAAFPTFQQGASVNIPVSVFNNTGAAAKIFGFIDWNGDGDFADTNETLAATNVSSSATQQIVNVVAVVPSAATSVNVGARFRVSSDASLSSVGWSGSGEVEDYRVSVTLPTLDFGDFTGFPSASSAVVNNLSLGLTVDKEYVLTATTAADGDDITGTPDEDGVWLPFSVFPGQTGATFLVYETNTTGAAVYLNAWIDFNGDGLVTGPGEQIVTNRGIANGRANFADTVSFTVPAGATVGARPLRLRLTHLPDPGIDGQDFNGEVEDHLINIVASHISDFGDWNGSGAATAATSSTSDANLKIGYFVDAEGGVVPNAGATTDDLLGSIDDEDGAVVPLSLTQGSSVSIPVVVTNATGANAWLNGWIDFNNDGAFNDTLVSLGGERLEAARLIPTGTSNVTQLITVNVPVGATIATQRGVRLRLTNQAVTAPTGIVGNGEIEDYVTNIVAATTDFGDAPASYGVASHILTASVGLGVVGDAEASSQSNSTATGDDTAGTPDDEEGLFFDLPMVPGREASVVIASRGVGYSNLWIDFNRDGDFADAGEQVVVNNLKNSVFTNINPQQPDPYSDRFTVPANANPGATFARARVTGTSWSGGPTGSASSGEVEDFAVIILPASTISGRLWADVNANGIRDAGEPAASNLVVTLRRADGKAEATALADSNGVYSFGALPSGNYTVQVRLPAGHTLSGIDLGGNDTVDSDFIVATATTNAITLASGASVANVDAGIQGVVVAGIASQRLTVGSVKALSDTDWTHGFVLPKFDPTLGTLTGVEVQTTFLRRNDFLAESTGSGSDVDLALTNALSLTLPDGSQQAVSNVDSSTINLAAFDGNLDYHNTSGVASWDIFRDTSLGTTTYSTLADFIAATSGETRTLTGVTDVSGDISTTGGNSAYSLRTRIGGIVTVTYTYTPPTHDFGDYTGFAAASQKVSADIRIGTLATDAEASSPTTGLATADDTTGVDDEDLVLPMSFYIGTTRSLAIPVYRNDAALSGNTATVRVFIDWNNDGDADDTNETVVHGSTLNQGSNYTYNYTLTVPAGTTPGIKYLRVRATESSAVPTLAGASALKGEVEDYPIYVTNTLDFGDAPDAAVGYATGNYKTSLADDGARHGILSSIFLGASAPDAEANATANAAATGDDTTGTDDEDGLTSSLSFARLGNASANLTVTNNTGAPARLFGWIDFNGDGWFSAAESAMVMVPNGSNGATVTVDFGTVPYGAVSATYARFRLSTDAAAANSHGVAGDGEVEDYPVMISGLVDLCPVDAPTSATTLSLSGGAPTSTSQFVADLGAWGGERDVTLEYTAGGGSISYSSNLADAFFINAPYFDFSSTASDKLRTTITYDGPDGNASVVNHTGLGFNLSGSAPFYLELFMDNPSVNFSPAPAQVTLRVYTDATNWSQQQITVARPFTDAGPATFAPVLIPRTGFTTGGGAGVNWSNVGAIQLVFEHLGNGSDSAIARFMGPCSGDFGDWNGSGALTASTRSAVDTRLRLGAAVDAEPGVLANATASTDDVVGADDEDGVVVPASMIVGGTATLNTTVTNTTGSAGFLNAWIDFNRDGDFGDANEQVASNVNVADGTNGGALNLPVSIPVGALVGTTGVRVRLTSVNTTGPTGLSGVGEVEDYIVNLVAPTTDFGDHSLFHSAGTTASSSIKLGANAADTEAVATTNTSANGDDITATDDEDGMTQSALYQAQPGTVTINVTNTSAADAYLNAWIDWNNNGTVEAGEQIVTGQVIATGTNGVGQVVNLNVPTAAVVGSVGMRVRLSSTSSTAFSGMFGTGEVEDHLITISAPNLDFGDLVDTGAGTGVNNYETLLTSNGPRHTTLAGLRLGSAWDADVVAQQSGSADGDDNNGADDEDAFSTLPVLTLGSSTNVTAAVTNTTGSNKYLSAWVDFNNNGSFEDAGERVTADQVVANGAPTTAISINTPVGATIATTGFRVRLSATTGLTSVGLGGQGEVEDYLIGIGCPVVVVHPLTSTLTPPAHLGFPYSVTFSQTGSPGTITFSSSTTPPVPGMTLNPTTGVVQGSPTAAGSFTFRITAADELGCSGFRDYTLLVLNEDHGDYSLFPDAWSGVSSNLRLGTTTDNEATANVTINAMGDDNTGSDDEDGVTAADIPQGNPGNIVVNVTNTTGATAYLSTWVDWNNDGDVNDTDEFISTLTVANGSVNANRNVTYTCPSDAFVGNVGVRVRLTSVSAPGVDGLDGLGEVEDTMLKIEGPDQDRGDFSGFGLFGRSTISNNIRLGAQVDPESWPRLNSTATGDDDDNLDDEDGIAFPAAIVQGNTHTLPISYRNISASAGYLSVWVDWNGNGVLTDAGDEILDNMSVPAGTADSVHNLPLSIPWTTPVGTELAMRVRLTTTNNTSPTATTGTGEVEDYEFTVAQPGAIGDRVWIDTDGDGLFEFANGELPLDGVLVNLYLDDGDGTLDAGDTLRASQTTYSGGQYRFRGLPPANYIVEVAASNFASGGILFDFVSSTGGVDPDDNVNHDDNGVPVAGFGVASSAITLTADGEPDTDGDTDKYSNLTVDFGFVCNKVMIYDALVSNHGNDKISNFHYITGASRGDFVAGGAGSLSRPYDITIGPAGDLFVTSSFDGAVRRYSGSTGAFISAFVSAGSGGLSQPTGLTFGPDGHLYVSSRGTGHIKRYNGSTGAYLNDFISTGLAEPFQGLLFGPDGHLYVSNFTSGQIRKHNGMTGAYIASVTLPAVTARGLVFGHDGSLYAANHTNILYKIDPAAMTSSTFATGPSEYYFGVSVAPDGHLLATASSGVVRKFHVTTGADMGLYINATSTLGEPKETIFYPRLQHHEHRKPGIQ